MGTGNSRLSYFANLRLKTLLSSKFFERYLPAELRLIHSPYNRRDAQARRAQTTSGPKLGIELFRTPGRTAGRTVFSHSEPGNFTIGLYSYIGRQQNNVSCYAQPDRCR